MKFSLFDLRSKSNESSSMKKLRLSQIGKDISILQSWVEVRGFNINFHFHVFYSKMLVLSDCNTIFNSVLASKNTCFHLIFIISYKIQLSHQKSNKISIITTQVKLAIALFSIILLLSRPLSITLLPVTVLTVLIALVL